MNIATKSMEIQSICRINQWTDILPRPLHSGDDSIFYSDTSTLPFVPAAKHQQKNKVHLQGDLTITRFTGMW